MELEKTPSHVSHIVTVFNCHLLLKPLTKGIFLIFRWSDGAWFHRYWVVSQFNVNLTSEFSLCSVLLNEDQRNFHCWNYRRFLVHHIMCATAVAAPEKVAPLRASEMAYSNAKIIENFSNYSAFHHRSTFIKDASDDPKVTIKCELAMVESAVFTEPDDQSAWWYHQFLLKWATELSKNSSAFSIEAEREMWLAMLLLEQLTCLEKLLSIENQCKWAMIAKFSVINLLVTLQHFFTDTCKDKAISASQLCSDRKNVLMTLIEIDHAHANRYRYLLQQHCA